MKGSSDKGINVSGINFIGISAAGKPVTRDMLQKAGIEGWDKALVEVDDIEKLPDSERRLRLQTRLEMQITQKGRLLKDGIINFVPLLLAAQIGDVEAVQTRLATGMDPNEAYLERRSPDNIKVC